MFPVFFLDQYFAESGEGSENCDDGGSDIWKGKPK